MEWIRDDSTSARVISGLWTPQPRHRWCNATSVWFRTTNNQRRWCSTTAARLRSARSALASLRSGNEARANDGCMLDRARHADVSSRTRNDARTFPGLSRARHARVRATRDRRCDRVRRVRGQSARLRSLPARRPGHHRTSWTRVTFRTQRSIECTASRASATWLPRAPSKVSFSADAEDRLTQIAGRSLVPLALTPCM